MGVQFRCRLRVDLQHRSSDYKNDLGLPFRFLNWRGCGFRGVRVRRPDFEAAENQKGGNRDCSSLRNRLLMLHPGTGCVCSRTVAMVWKSSWGWMVWRGTNP